ncbi:hypothetical protein EGH24_00755 [Halonotius terrestris]|uniref:DUF7315 domain-containing protein n=1 Tax=Halonotius terrestris TaxID=2487750 RepID=A0A8J8TDN5_9EURY|nr:hypothetical protein [Halonotius terrestris]TQQ83364.1 hypothetical protein EGH24_00755 [Halonotius terrestris]
MVDSDAASDESAATEPADSATGRRDVVVPMRLYKTITVFSTLIATACILAGFILLDAATLQVSVLRTVLLRGLAGIGLAVDQELFSVLLGIGGLSLMAVGTGVFVLSSRFRAPGMGNPQEDSDEG